MLTTRTIAIGGIVLYNISPPVSSGTTGYFTHISINTPIVPALKNYYIWSFLEVPTDFFNYFWVQLAVSILKRRTAV
jgi:hypothetical protein